MLHSVINEVDIFMCLVDMKYLLILILQFRVLEFIISFFLILGNVLSPWKSTGALGSQYLIGKMTRTSGLVALPRAPLHEAPLPCHSTENAFPVAPSSTFRAEPFTDVTELEEGRNEA